MTLEPGLAVSIHIGLCKCRAFDKVVNIWHTYLSAFKSNLTTAFDE
jgi:hypothetical protein